MLVEGRLARHDDEVPDAEALREEIGLEGIRVEPDLLDVRQRVLPSREVDQAAVRSSATEEVTRVVRNHRDSSGAQTIVTTTRSPPVIRLET